MPNWCSNTVIIKGEYQDVQRLLDTVESGKSKFSLNNLITVPYELLNTSAPSNATPEEKERLKALYGAVDWYDWQVNNWGTKWDVEATISNDSHANNNPAFLSKLQTGNRVVTINFDSAWAPPSPAMKVLAKQFPNTNIYHVYDEPGVDFGGYAMYSKGECLKEEEGSSFYVMKTYFEPDDDIFDYFPDNDQRGNE